MIIRDILRESGREGFSRPGQVALYLVVTLVAIFIMALMAVDVFLSVRTKNNLQNAGDAAALAAAHRQGELINKIGMLNLEHIKAALDYDTNECERIVMEQHRLALIEPVYALKQADTAARCNCMCEREEFSNTLRDHIEEIMLLYKGGPGDEYDPYAEPYPGAWDEYAVAIENVIANGLAAGVDNIEYYQIFGNHLLLNAAFYNAIAGEDWCWFYFNCMSTLQNYNSYHDWSPLPIHVNNSTENSEIFSLFVQAKKCAIADTFRGDTLIEIANKYGEMNIRKEDYMKPKPLPEDAPEGTEPEMELDNGLLNDPNQKWFFFDPRRWGMWFSGKKLYSDGDDAYDFPIVGSVKEEYNVAGCAAVCRTYKQCCSFSTDTCNTLGWNAAAKPFGTIEKLDGEIVPVTGLENFVVPCMTETRLVGVDTVMRSNLGTADINWLRHIREHLPEYMFSGPDRNNGCIFCEQLVKWESSYFRNRGLNWLTYNSGKCYRPVDSNSNKSKCCNCDSKGKGSGRCPFCGSGGNGNGGSYRGH